MKRNKNSWILNLLILVTVLIWAVTFGSHYKNWHRIKGNQLQLLSGFYFREIPFEKVDSVALVDRIPKMERVQGFSWLQNEKGIFKDTVSNTELLVLVDDLSQPKIKLVYKDSLKVYLNFKDSVETKAIFDKLSIIIAPEAEGN